MKRVFVHTPISMSKEIVQESFDYDLLQYVLPWFLKVELYEGKDLEDKTKINCLYFDVFCISQVIFTWDNKQSTGVEQEGIYTSLFTKWCHITNIVRNKEDSCTIIDDVSFSSGNIFLDYLYYIPIKLLFWHRSIKYKQFFSRL